MLYQFPNIKRLRNNITAPIIYSLIIPLVVVDLWIEIYHRICFPLYGITCVKRKNYIKIDRYKLSKLSLIEKINCSYCGYANGLIAYVQEIAGRTEKYWCAIKHEQDPDFIPPKHHQGFFERKQFE